MSEKIPSVPAREITPEDTYRSRRTFLKGMVAVGATAASAVAFRQLIPRPPQRRIAPGAGPVPTAAAVKAAPLADDPLTPFEDITNYNNYYEFSTDKYEVAGLAQRWKPERPWTITVEGECNRPGAYDLDALVKLSPPEERIYRMRCVEGWSMVIPWLGMPLGKLLAHFEPTSRAKFVEMTTIRDSENMPGAKDDVLDWPYVEGLRMDEAMHRLSILSTGLYGQDLLGQNGAPVRLVVPWKYGFKGVKSIVRLRFVDHQPNTTWNLAAPSEYGFFSNVNPDVAHPRWSQAKERRIGESSKRKTLPFNGYADEVAALYAGMDLEKNF